MVSYHVSSTSFYKEGTVNTLMTVIALLITIGTSTLQGQVARPELQQQIRTRIYMIPNVQLFGGG